MGGHKGPLGISDAAWSLVHSEERIFTNFVRSIDGSACVVAAFRV